MNKDMLITTQADRDQLRRFFSDGLRDCSWLPDNFLELLDFCCRQNVMLTKDVLVIFMDNGKFTYIDTIYVMRKARNKGLGKTILKYFTDMSRTCIICNKKLIPFYESLGFKQDNDLPYAVMIKEKD